MDNETYLEESGRTIAPDIHTELSPLETSLLRRAFSDGIVAGQCCDSIKRKLFYGLDQEERHLPSNVIALNGLGGSALTEHLKQFASSHDANDLIHGIIGGAGEAGELLDALATAMITQTEIDRINVIEEIGDQLWYLALTLRAVNSTFDEAMELNIQKLKNRYPEQWSQESVLNRDVESEREILEQANSS